MWQCTIHAGTCTAIHSHQHGHVVCCMQDRSAEAAAYAFFPVTYVVPREYRMFVEEFKRTGGTWIMKVNFASRTWQHKAAARLVCHSIRLVHSNSIQCPEAENETAVRAYQGRALGACLMLEQCTSKCC